MSTQLAVGGIQITAPPGWASESFVDPNGLGIYRVASFQFPDDANDDTGQTARALMQGSDILINIIDFTVSDPDNTNDYYVPMTPPVIIDGSDAVGQEGYPLTVVAVIFGAWIFGRALYISVSFGAEPSAAQVVAANAVLATLAPA